MTAESPRASGLISALLADQADLSAVERFAQFHEDVESHLHGPLYRALMPAASPGPGQQYAFEVDLDSCSGCKACVAACHALNGLDDAESWRDVGLIVGRSSGPGLPVIQHVTSSCHHCLDPACLTACPVDAYEKDPITGIVRHLDDQCFGCQYCTLACPYDAPKYHAGKGIVRKCDMCSDRLVSGEAPACVQSCPHEAIRVRVVDRAEVSARAEAGVFLPAAPDPASTRPTTLYRTSRPLVGDVLAADAHRDRPEHAHASLIAMLVLTQASAGAFAADTLLRLCGVQARAAAILLILGATLGHAGLAASLFHLGRPQFAYRALIGLRHSWLSREVAAFGVFSLLSVTHAALAWMPCGSPMVAEILSPLATASGLAGVACSAMVYHATRRPFWHLRRALPQFAGTAAVLGPLVLLVSASMSGERGIGLAAAVAAIVAAAIKLGRESGLLTPLDDREPTPMGRSARLLKGPLAGLWRARRSLGFAGGIFLPLLSTGLGPPMIPAAGIFAAGLSLLLATAGEMAERTLFFAAVVRPKMPGGLAS